jgi:hypothetical protein
MGAFEIKIGAGVPEILLEKRRMNPARPRSESNGEEQGTAQAR